MTASPERVELIVNLIAAGLKTDDIRRSTGASTNMIAKLRREHGLPVPKRKAKVPRYVQLYRPLHPVRHDKARVEAFLKSWLQAVRKEEWKWSSK